MAHVYACHLSKTCNILRNDIHKNGGYVETIASILKGCLAPNVHVNRIIAVSVTNKSRCFSAFVIAIHMAQDSSLSNHRGGVGVINLRNFRLVNSTS